MDTVDKIIAYETGELSDNEILYLFAELVRTGLAWELQGSYGRMAHSLIESGYISRTGKVLKHAQESEV